MSTIDAVSSYSIKSNYSSSSSDNDTLSKDTIKKLEEYGIDPAGVSSETEAKKLIKEAEAEEEAKAAAQQDDLYSRVKDLADKLGIQVSKNDDFDSTFSKLSSKIDVLKGDGNGSDYNVIKSEYETLKLQYESGSSSTMNALDLLGQSNRIGAGL